MDKLISRFGGDSIVEKIYNSQIKYFFYAVIIQYLSFLLFEFIDIILESFFFDNSLFVFFFLRFFFFGFSLIIQIVVIIITIVSFSFLDRIKGSEYIESRIFRTFVNVIIGVYIAWTIILIGTFIPRVIILMRNREKIGNSIRILMYFKFFLMISIYIDLLIIYIFNKEKKEKNEDK